MENGLTMIGMSINTKRKQNGYTLIELLLVVTVIALIAALGVKTYRDKAASDRINIAALNIQHVLEAGMSYNVANAGLWPEINWNQSGCASGSAITDKNFAQNYLPNESNQSNFGTALCWSGDDPNDPTKPQKGKRFWVALNVGISSGANSVAVTTAQRIAARLPNAIITSNPNDENTTPANTCTSGQPCYVKAVVSIPSASDNNKMYLAGAGNCDSDIPTTAPVQPGSGTGVSCRRTSLAEQFDQAADDTTLDSLSQYEIDFQCQPGETPNVYVTPNFVRMDTYSGQPAPTQQLPMYQLSGAPENNPYSGKPPNYVDYTKYCPAPDADGTVKCTVTMSASWGYMNDGTRVDVGCTTHMQDDLHVCTCYPKINTSNGVAGGCATRPGAVGASYVAVCNPATAPSGLKASATNKSYW